MNTHDTVALEIPLDQIEPSPFQYRRTINESRLAELAASIKARGVQQRVR